MTLEIRVQTTFASKAPRPNDHLIGAGFAINGNFLCRLRGEEITGLQALFAHICVRARNGHDHAPVLRLWQMLGCLLSQLRDGVRHQHLKGCVGRRCVSGIGRAHGGVDCLDQRGQYIYCRQGGINLVLTESQTRRGKEKNVVGHGVQESSDARAKM